MLLDINGESRVVRLPTPGVNSTTPKEDLALLG